MLCISRITDDTYAQQFGNRHNKFYLEFRCNLPCAIGKDVCTKCSDKTSNIQTSRKFNHGKVNEPIPDASHIYGGKWYNEAVKKYGAPPPDIIEFAQKYQKDARSGLGQIVEPEIRDTTESPVIQAEPIKKKGRKSKVVLDDGETTITNQEAKPKKRRPKVASEATQSEATRSEATQSEVTRSEAIQNEVVEPSKKPIIIIKKAAATRKTPTNTSPYTALVTPTTQLVHKEVTLPTHIETTLEEIDSEDYEIDYVKLQIFEVGQATYFRDSTKNKLYKKIKDKGIGPYVGRWNPDTESIQTDIPDSDDEN
jgi:hypothetical protein